MKYKYHLSIACLLMTSGFLQAVDVIEQPLTESIIRTTINKKPQRNMDFFTRITESNEVISPRSYYEQEYLIESGQFINKEKKTVSFVIVTSSQNEITSIVENHGQTDVITVSADGKENLMRGGNRDFLHGEDFIVGNVPPPGPRLGMAEIKILAAYSMTALNNLNLDPIAYALAQLETVSQGLSNSKIPDIKLVLGGVLILNTNDAYYNTSGTGVSNWQAIMEPFRALYKTDINMAIATVNNSGNAGVAYLGGYTSVNAWEYPTAFRHELGHNVGGNHCWPEGSEDYKHGHNNGRSTTILCGNDTPYYSNPNLVDGYGLPLGNADRADMARLWQEQASRMASYNSPLEGYKFIFTSVKKRHAKTFDVSLPILNTYPAGGFVALSAAVGPTELQAYPVGDYTTLNVPLRDMQNVNHNVVLRAQRSVGGCIWGPMNQATACNSTERNLTLHIIYEPDDNPLLPAGAYNGLLQLRAKEVNDASFNPLVNLPLSIVK